MRKLLVRFLSLGAHGIQMSGHSQTKLSDYLALLRSTVLEARPNTLHCQHRLAMGHAQIQGLGVCVTQVLVALFCDYNTFALQGWYGCTWS
jgi:hypothetical protein